VAAATTAPGAGNVAANTAGAGANANAGAGAAVIEDEQVPLAVNDEDLGDNEEVIAPEDTNTANDAGIVGIEDEDTPLGAAEEIGTKRKWYWWILLIIAAITGKTGYDKKNKKNLFAEKDKE
jgi:hypothetical protein